MFYLNLRPLLDVSDDAICKYLNNLKISKYLLLILWVINCYLDIFNIILLINTINNTTFILYIFYLNNVLQKLNWMMPNVISICHCTSINLLGVTWTVNELVPSMLASQAAWDGVSRFCENCMLRREKLERALQQLHALPALNSWWRKLDSLLEDCPLTHPRGEE